MVDSAEWLAIGLGILAVAIAIWDDVRDRYYCWIGPVRAELVRFDIPQPNVRVAEGADGIHIQMTWACVNRVSWAVLTGFEFKYNIEAGGRLVKITLRDEHFQDLISNQVYLPPRQPVERTLCVVWPLDKRGEVTPLVSVFSGRWQSRTWPSRALTWIGGRPSLGG